MHLHLRSPLSCFLWCVQMQRFPDPSTACTPRRQLDITAPPFPCLHLPCRLEPHQPFPSDTRLVWQGCHGMAASEAGGLLRCSCMFGVALQLWLEDASSWRAIQPARSHQSGLQRGYQEAIRSSRQTSLNTTPAESGSHVLTFDEYAVAEAIVTVAMMHTNRCISTAISTTRVLSSA